MSNKKQTKRALCASILSVIVCATMLIGSTFAWFTDSVTSKNNVIQSGSLEVSMEWKDGTSDPEAETGWKDASGAEIFDHELWEPGYTEVRHVRISNRGDLALKYEIGIVTDGEVGKLAEVIDVYYIEGGRQIADRSALADLKPVGTLKEVMNSPSAAAGNLQGGTSDTATIALKMRENAGNDYQGESIGSGFTVQLRAAQDTFETDAFDDQYDKDVSYPVYAGTEEELKDAIAEVEDGGTVMLTENVEVSEPLKFSDKDVRIQLNGKALASEKPVNMIEAAGTAEVSVSGGTLTVANDDAAAVFAQDDAAVLVEDCEIRYTGRWGYVVCTNGSSSKDASIVMKNTEIVSSKNYACYFPAGTIRLENCNVTGAVIISGGDVTIDGGTYRADGFAGQAKIWHEADTIDYMKQFASRDGCGHMGDSILIMDRRAQGYSLTGVTVKNAVFHTELSLADGSRATAYAVKYVDYNNVLGAEPVKYVIENNTYQDKLENGKDPLMFIDIP